MARGPLAPQTGHTLQTKVSAQYWLFYSNISENIEIEICYNVTSVCVASFLTPRFLRELLPWLRWPPRWGGRLPSPNFTFSKSGIFLVLFWDQFWSGLTLMAKMATTMGRKVAIADFTFSTSGIFLVLFFINFGHV